MVITVKDRVKKHRAKKSITAEGAEEIRAKNRLYARRFRAKKILKKVQEDLAKTKFEAISVLSVRDLQDISRFVNQYKVNLIKNTYQDRSIPSCEKVDVETKIVQYEISMLRRMSEGTNHDYLIQRQISSPARLETLPPSLDNKRKTVSPECSTPSEASEAVETEVDAFDWIGRSINQQLHRQFTAPVISSSHLDLEPISSYIDPFIPSGNLGLGLLPFAPALSNPTNHLDLMSSNSLQRDGLRSGEEMIAALSSSLDLSHIADNCDNFLDELAGDSDIVNDSIPYSLGL